MPFHEDPAMRASQASNETSQENATDFAPNPQFYLSSATRFEIRPLPRGALDPRSGLAALDRVFGWGVVL
jgi:hypothetical protein